MEERVGIQSIFKEQSKIIELIALENLPLSDILEELTRTVDLVMPNIKSSILLYDGKNHRLEQGIGPNLPAEYLNAIEGIEPGPQAGSCGTAVFYGKTIIAEDTTTDPLWEPFRELSTKYSLIACWSKPIISSTKEILGTMAFYYNEKRKPTKQELELIDTFANLAGLIISKKRTEQTLQLSHAVVENSSVVLVRWKAEQGWPLEYVSKNISQFGYTPEEFLTEKKEFESIIHPDDAARVKEEVAYYSDQEMDSFTQEYRIITQDGVVRWVDDRTIIERNNEGNITYFQGIILDITKRKEAEQTIEFLANNDPLTKLPNRRLLMEKLTAKLKRAASNQSKLAVLFLDIDNFKDVNDLFGHSFGDQLLQQVAEKLKQSIPDHCIASRVSGDEFAFILTELASCDEVKKICTSILDAVQRTYRIDNKEFLITASMGISIFPDHGKTPETLLKNADLAMYSTKKAGKNDYQVYNTTLHEKVFQKKVLENELKEAVEKKQFTLHYQPQCDIHTNEMKGMEALVRWDHPVRGLISPIEFIPLAEETGLIMEIDQWVLQEACAQHAEWRKRKLTPPPLKVNVSAQQFYNEKLLENVLKVLRKTGMDPSFLELEITEGTLMAKADRTVNVLKRLKETGVKISVDDFGTGYSSLSYLKSIPMDTLKIDKSFVREVEKNSTDAAIVKTILSLAHDLRLHVIAEGVETPDQLAFLKKVNCPEAQGYLFSPPLPKEDITKLFPENAFSFRDR